MEVNKSTMLAVLARNSSAAFQTTVDGLRQRYESSAMEQRWPAHVTVLYPFVATGNSRVLQALQAVCGTAQPLTLTVARSVGVFSHKTSAALVLLPHAPALCALQLSLAHTLLALTGAGVSDSRPFVPHLTIGHVATNPRSPAHSLDAAMADINASLSLLSSADLEFTVDSLYILSRDPAIHLHPVRDRYHVVGELKLGQPLHIPRIHPADPASVVSVAKRKRQTPDHIAIQHSAVTLQSVVPTQNSQTSVVPFTVSIVTYNVLHSSDNFPSLPDSCFPPADNSARWNSIIDLTFSKSPDVVVFQECTPAFIQLLHSHQASQTYSISHNLETVSGTIATVMLSRLQLVGTYNLVQLSPGKLAPVADFLFPSSSLILRVAGVHLSSDYQSDKHALRISQISNLIQYLSNSPIATAHLNSPVLSIIAGDFNEDLEFRESENFFDKVQEIVPPEFQDISKSTGATFAIDKNPYAKQTARHKTDRGYRLDRVLLKYPKLENAFDGQITRRLCWWNSECEVIGDGNNNGEKIASDHFGVWCRLKFGALLADLPESENTESKEIVNNIDTKSEDSEFENVIAELKFVGVDLTLSSSGITDSDLNAYLQEALPANPDIYTQAFNSLQHYIHSLFSQQTPPVYYMQPIGSFALGCHSESSDLDILCGGVMRYPDFVHLLANQQSNDVKLVRTIESRVPVIELKVGEIKVDLQYAWIPQLLPLYISLKPTKYSEFNDYVDALLKAFYDNSVGKKMDVEREEFLKQSKTLMDKLPASTYPNIASRLDVLIILSKIKTKEDLESFRVARKFLKRWACQRGIYGKFASIGGYTLTVLVTKICTIIYASGGSVSASEIVKKFFEVYSQWDWKFEVCVDAREHCGENKFPMTVLQIAPINPVHPAARGNASRNATVVGVRVFKDELKRGQVMMNSVLDSSVLLDKLCQIYPFIEKNPHFIRIEVYAETVTLYRDLCATIESRSIISMLLSISQHLPGTYARVWPYRLTEPETRRDGYNGFYLIALRKGKKNDKQNQIQWETIISRICSWLTTSIPQQQHESTTNVYAYLTPQNSLLSEFPNIANIQSLHDAQQQQQLDSISPQDLYQLHHLQQQKQTGVAVATNKNSEVLKGKGNLRTSQDVYNRIVWDPTLNIEEFVVGYEDRFTGIQEIPVKLFHENRKVGPDGNDEWIPFHRVWYFKRVAGDGVGEKVWDRGSGVDLVFKK